MRSRRRAVIAARMGEFGARMGAILGPGRTMREALPVPADRLAGEAKRLRVDLEPWELEGGATFNPSVCAWRGELWATVRVLCPDGVWSENLLCTLGDDGEPRGVERIATVGHCEDLRLFVVGDALHAIGTSYPKPAGDNVSVVVMRLVGPAPLYEHVIASRRQEKNWMPIPMGEALWLLYALEPVPSVLRFDEETGEVTPRPEDVPLPDGGGTLRGGSALVPYGDGFLAVVHHVHRKGAGMRAPVVYLHRFVRFDRFLRVERMSEPFHFQETPGVEFCAGLAEWRGGWVLSYGVADREAWVKRVTAEEVARRVGGP